MAPAPTADPVFAAVMRRVLALHPDDQEGRMLRSPGLRTAGKFYAFSSGDGVIVKLPAPRVAELVAGGDGLPCSPRPGRPMREWVELPACDEEPCLAYVLEARAFVASLAR